MFIAGAVLIGSGVVFDTLGAMCLAVPQLRTQVPQGAAIGLLVFGGLCMSSGVLCLVLG
jgi:hypothetical protein